MIPKWEGVYPAVTTKFTADDKLDFDAIGTNFQAQIDAGVHGLILGGSLGEASTLDDDEKFELLAFTLDLVKEKIPVVLNITEGSTRRAISYVKKAEQMGADGFMALPPMRYKSDDRETVISLSPTNYFLFLSLTVKPLKALPKLSISAPNSVLNLLHCSLLSAL